MKKISSQKQPSVQETADALDLVVTAPPLVTVPEDKQATLAALTHLFQQKYGTHVLQTGASLAPVTFLPTGIAALDDILGGGLPQGRLIELWGNDENAKLSLLYSMMKNYGKHVLYVDGERAADKNLLAAFGVSPDISIVHPQSIEDALSMIVQFAEKGMPFIVVDSLVSLLPLKEREETDFYKQAGVSMVANLLSRKIYDLVAKAYASGTTVIFTNQLRDKVNARPFGEQYKAPGGHAIQHACSLVLRLARVGYLKMAVSGQQLTYGQETAVQVYQSKVSRPNQDTSLYLVYGHGFYDMFEIGKMKKQLAAQLADKKIVSVKEENLENLENGEDNAREE